VGKRPLHDEDLDVTFKSGGEERPCHSTDILYFDAFQKLGLTDRDLAALTSTLTGFTEDSVSPLGATTIPVTFGGEPKSKTLMVSFMVVKLPSAYNAIIEHPTLNRLRAVVSTYHRILKFSTRAGVSEVRSDPRESKQCYLTAMTLSKKPRTQSAATVPRDPEDSARDPHLTEKQPMGLGQVVLNLVQLLFRGLVPSKRLISLPLGLLELLLQLGCTLLALANRLRTSVIFQSIEFFLKLLDPVVHERDQSTRVMDSVEERHLEVLALHETKTIRSSAREEPALPSYRSGSLPRPSPWRLGLSGHPRGAYRAPAPVGGGEVPSRTPPLSTSSAPSIWPSSLSRGLGAPGWTLAMCNNPHRPCAPLF
ncbi:hypothetical protein BHM03_00026684, partial [Ensete ventricosum]